MAVELPLDIHNDNATYETQFGHVQRPTHKNTTWDIAKFEVCGHKASLITSRLLQILTMLSSMPT